MSRLKVSHPVRVGVDTYPDRPICRYVEAILPAAGSEFALVPPDNATGNFTKIVRRFTVRIRFSPRDANAALARPGMSVETAVAVSTPDDASPTERGNRVGCSIPISFRRRGGNCLPGGRQSPLRQHRLPVCRSILRERRHGRRGFGRRHMLANIFAKQTKPPEAQLN